MTIIVATVAVSGSNDKPQQPVGGVQSQLPSKDSSVKPDQPVVVTPEGMIAPVETVTVIHEYGFYHNQTLGAYYEHAGVDFAASAGTQVLAAESGVVESIYKDDLLTGTEIVINHGDGLKTVYRFVTETEGLKVGDKVEKGDVIACVAEANGNEYKDGAHLHFEVRKDGKTVDPAVYLTLEEK
jgi:murein DD-endopeptidase MepM/ murein hydrolase activator NlpD